MTFDVFQFTGMTAAVGAREILPGDLPSVVKLLDTFAKRKLKVPVVKLINYRNFHALNLFALSDHPSTFQGQTQTKISYKLRVNILLLIPPSSSGIYIIFTFIIAKVK